MGDDPVQVKFECKEVDPCENSRAVHVSPHNSGTVIDSEKVQLMRIENRYDLCNEPLTKVVRHPSFLQNGVQIPKYGVSA